MFGICWHFCNSCLALIHFHLVRDSCLISIFFLSFSRFRVFAIDIFTPRKFNFTPRKFNFTPRKLNFTPRKLNVAYLLQTLVLSASSGLRLLVSKILGVKAAGKSFG